VGKLDGKRRELGPSALMDSTRAWEPTIHSRRLSGRRGRDTAPELVLRRRLHSSGLRYRVAYRALGRTTIDIAFTRLRLAVFVDGCFWHGCPIHGRAVSHGPNAGRWEWKFARNRQRDARVSVELQALGWTVVRLWECEILGDLDGVVDTLVQHLACCDRERDASSARRTLVRHHDGVQDAMISPWASVRIVRSV
jgi:DNA mismatch endonuclease (patch repair protein)